MIFCLKCQAQYLTAKLGVFVIDKSQGQPSRVWRADLLECPLCSHQMLAHFGHEPIMESFEAGFYKYLQDIRKRAGHWVFEVNHADIPALASVEPFVKRRPT